MFTYHEGDTVALVVEDYVDLGLRAGDEGVVWAIYELPIPAYEITFRGEDGRDFDLTVSQEEITFAKAHPVPIA